ncbi:MAG TPA: DUF1223 domain-containing protein [Bryobacteraceae bacterium]|nr:DUF1223 domain-containing protein [Bryobacteraceae bacterium]
MKSLWLVILTAVQAAEPTPHVAVLAELFTSEGCSSCPPADALLMKLDRMQPVPGAQIIVLSEHVDYWNQLGWSDPFSSAQFSQRQAMYAHAFVDDSYTPQLVIDGRAAFIGSHEREILPALAKAASRPKISVKIAAVKREGNDAVISLATGESARKAEVWVAIADDRDQSNVRRGENSGRTLTHVAVVRSLAKVGTVAKAASLEKEVRVPLGAQSGPGRIVVFVAESGGPVVGAALRELP